jgi:hypothetical protein
MTDSADSRMPLKVRLPHDWNIHARLVPGGELKPEMLAVAVGADGSVFYFKTPIDLDGFNPAIRFQCVKAGASLMTFASPCYILPRKAFDLAKGFFVVKTSIAKSICKESEARFISSNLAALSLMKSVQDAIVEYSGSADLTRLKANLETFVGNPDGARQWIKAARKRNGFGFPTNGFEFWKRIYVLMFWNTLCGIRTPQKNGKGGGGWDTDKAADQLNRYFRSRHSHLGELEQYAEWKPYTGRWLREFEANAGLLSKAPDGRKK